MKLRTYELHDPKAYERPEWKRKRWQILLRDGFRCTFCQRVVEKADDLRYFNCHHYTYTTWPPWEEPDHNLTTLCSQCHAEYHGKLDEYRSSFRKSAPKPPQKRKIVYKRPSFRKSAPKYRSSFRSAPKYR